MPAPQKVTNEQVLEAIRRIDEEQSTITAEAERLGISSQGLGKRIKKVKKETMKVSMKPTIPLPPIGSPPSMIDDGPGLVAPSTPDDIDRALDTRPQTALEFIELVQQYMHEHPDDSLVKKVLRHLPSNPEWEGGLSAKAGGGWSGVWKDFAALLEKALRWQA